MNDLEREILHDVLSQRDPYQVDPTEQSTLWHVAVQSLFDAGNLTYAEVDDHLWFLLETKASLAAYQQPLTTSSLRSDPTREEESTTSPVPDNDAGKFRPYKPDDTDIIILNTYLEKYPHNMKANEVFVDMLNRGLTSEGSLKWIAGKITGLKKQGFLDNTQRQDNPLGRGYFLTEQGLSWKPESKS